MIREVHVYGKVAPLRKTGEDERSHGVGEGAAQPHDVGEGASFGGVHSGGSGEGAQHLGLGRRLIEAACEIARAQGYQKINVISSVGTREYYQSLGFKDNDLYQQMSLS
jgi:histone acetyltransferase (RNA polymerase elongator complex component)